MKGKILIIHPEGNINNNPNLSGIVEILCENDFEITIYSPKKSFFQKSPHEKATLVLRSSLLERLKWKLARTAKIPIIVSTILSLFNTTKGSYDFVIGVDSQGITEANIIAKHLRRPYAFISYEIIFKSESIEHFKSLEIRACKDIEFAVCQDVIRAQKLSDENNIPLHKIIHIPVAGRGAKRGPKTKFLHEKLNIPSNKKIALFTGSLAEWTMIDELIDGLAYWPEQWVLVLHERYGEYNNIDGKIRKYIDSGLLYVSKNSFPEHKDIHILLHAADVGVAFYRPTFRSMLTGKNLEYLGLSSGKISTYLQHGLPVLTNEIGQISELIKEHNLGVVVTEITDVPKLLKNVRELDAFRNRCFDFFEQKLDLNKTSAIFIEHINAAIEPGKTGAQNAL